MSAKKFGYQLILVLRPKLEDAAREELLDKVEGWVKSEGVGGIKRNHFGLRDLVYKINKEDKGDFFVMDLESKEAKPFKELSLYLNREINIIRYLILKQE